MNAMLTSITLLIVASAFLIPSGIGNAKFAAAVNSNEGLSLTSSPNEEYLINCIVDGATDGVIQRFESLGCSSINGNMQVVSGIDTSDRAENAGISAINHNIGENINNMYQVDKNYFEDPYEVGWD